VIIRNADNAITAALGRAASPASTPTPTAAAGPASEPQPASGASNVDVEAVLTRFAARKKEKLDWRRSIVDLMKVLDLDSSLSARKHLTQELHYTGDTNDSAAMNIWLQSKSCESSRRTA